MAKRVKASDPALTNGYDGDKLRAYIEKLEGYQGDIESEKGSYMQRCKNIRDSMDVVYEEAKALGIPKKVLKAHVALRELERKKGMIVDKLSDDDAESFEIAADALGDFATLPLGEYAKKGRVDKADLAALDSLH